MVPVGQPAGTERNGSPKLRTPTVRVNARNLLSCDNTRAGSGQSNARPGSRGVSSPFWMRGSPVGGSGNECLCIRAARSNVERYQRVWPQPREPSVPSSSGSHALDLHPNKPRPYEPPADFGARTVAVADHTPLRCRGRLQAQPSQVRWTAQHGITGDRGRARAKLVLRQLRHTRRLQRVAEREGREHSEGHQHE